jgi:hypothetical protein
MFLVSVVETINFAGIEGEVIESSAHGNYVVVRLSDRITVIGTFSNEFNWQEAPDASSGFESFITYIGVRSPLEATQYVNVTANEGGYFHKNETLPRSSKRVTAFPLELKVRGLNADFVTRLATKD